MDLGWRFLPGFLLYELVHHVLARVVRARSGTRIYEPHVLERT